MALSEYEQRKLEEIERSLHSDDPGLATILNTGVVRRHRRVVAIATFAAGLAALVGGAVLALSLSWLGIVVSVLGFAGMAVGAGLFFTGRVRGGSQSASGRGGDAHTGPSWRSRMEQRFRARFDQPGE